jgi:probable rRNA maturation factor
MDIQIDNKQNRFKIANEILQKKTTAILNALGSPDGEISILIVDDNRMADLNEKYLHRKGPTNVIAFPMREGPYTEVSPNLLGDVVISIETALKEGEAGGVRLEQRFLELLIHGILHLFGYDHENPGDESQRMEEKSHELLQLINSPQNIFTIAETT